MKWWCTANVKCCINATSVRNGTNYKFAYYLDVANHTSSNAHTHKTRTNLKFDLMQSEANQRIEFSINYLDEVAKRILLVNTFLCNQWTEFDWIVHQPSYNSQKLREKKIRRKMKFERANSGVNCSSFENKRKSLTPTRINYSVQYASAAHFCQQFFMKFLQFHHLPFLEMDFHRKHQLKSTTEKEKPTQKSAHFFWNERKNEYQN